MLFLLRNKGVIISSIISVIISAIVLPCLIFLTDNLLADIFTFFGVFYVGFSLLWVIARTGVFDLFAYQIVNLSYSFLRGTPKKYKDAYSYKEQAYDKRKLNRYLWVPFLILGIIYLIVGISLTYSIQY